MNRCMGLWMMAIVLAGTAFAAPPTPFESLARMPVEEVTVFKDGHAFVLHSGRMPVDEAGRVVMDYLPNPVIGTFWPFSAEKDAKLSSTTASRRKALVPRTALTLKELIEANVGADVRVTEVPGTDGSTYSAKILGLPTQSGEELESLDIPYSGEKLSQRGDVALLETDEGVKVVNLDRILDISFAGDYKTELPREEFRNMLTLRLDWSGGAPQREAEVGLLYLQRGIRWIPNYKVAIDGEGEAIVTLQATLINEIADLEDVTAHLVIGVPTFAFQDTPDPISLQETVAQLSRHLRQDSQTALGFSNALMTQQALPMAEFRGRAETEAGPAMDLGPEVAGSAKSEDLFVFTVEHVSLRKGERMVLPVTEFTIKYKDVYSLDIPFAPPTEVWRNINSGRQAELARLFSSPKVTHKVRLFNDTEYPLTTAPALILLKDRLLAQGLMTYTAVGADTDLDITTAVDIRVKKTDNETKRTPNATIWQGDQYGRIDLAGKITLTNYGEDTVEVEVIRNVLGNVDSADNDGAIEMVNIFEDASFTRGGAPYPYWWGWFSWPWWWHHFNGIGRITWTAELAPNEPMDLLYTWNYYWR